MSAEVTGMSAENAQEDGALVAEVAIQGSVRVPGTELEVRYARINGEWVPAYAVVRGQVEDLPSCFTPNDASIAALDAALRDFSDWGPA